MILVTGGARSGKSTHAEKLAQAMGGKDVCYIATAEIFDSEMEDRVRRHREQRPSVWRTIEAPRGLTEAIREGSRGAKAILVDCLTVYVSNLMLAELPDNTILSEVHEIGRVAKTCGVPVIIVTNEVGGGVVPAYELGRRFRDLAGWANQIIARYADETYLTVCGHALPLGRLSGTGITSISDGSSDGSMCDGFRIEDGGVLAAPSDGKVLAKAIMVQGTASHVGKSVLSAALCRILAQDGYRVAPFKSQNMALNSAVTPDGLEMGRAQEVQAFAAGVEPSVLMNPILIKPTGESSAQIVVMGKPLGEMGAMEYRRDYVKKGLEIVKDALHRLMSDHDALVIEGAGSPAEVNLKDGDIVNMRIAKLAGAPVLLVADVDKGGSMASVVGTLALLDKDERDLVKGFIINKFRGDIGLYEPAVKFLENYTGKPVLGVIPYLWDIGMEEEDSVALDTPSPVAPRTGESDGDPVIAVIRLPRISNFTDFDALSREPGVRLTYVTAPSGLQGADAVIIPGTKDTIGDLEWMRTNGFDTAVIEAARQGKTILGICGGYQILGTTVEEEGKTISGLGLLPISTVFEPGKVTERVKARITKDSSCPWLPGDGEIEGYEIHMGISTCEPGARQPLAIIGESQEVPEACESEDGLVFGTYLHGLFDNGSLRRGFANWLRGSKGLEPLTSDTDDYAAKREASMNRLAAHVRSNLDMDRLYSIMGLTATEIPGGGSDDGMA